MWWQYIKGAAYVCYHQPEGKMMWVNSIYEYPVHKIVHENH